MVKEVKKVPNIRSKKVIKGAVKKSAPSIRPKNVSNAKRADNFSRIQRPVRGSSVKRGSGKSLVFRLVSLGVILILFIVLIILTYFLYQNIPGSPESLNPELKGVPEISYPGLIAQVKQFYPNIIYICVGYGEEEENIKNLVKELYLENQVI